MEQIFTYCPHCGSKDIEFPNLVRFLCHQCGFVYYHNIAAAVAVIFRREREILFAVRNIDPDKGKLDLPGGFIDPDENAEAAACREVNEELGLEITPTKICDYSTQSLFVQGCSLSHYGYFLRMSFGCACLCKSSR